MPKERVRKEDCKSPSVQQDKQEADLVRCQSAKLVQLFDIDRIEQRFRPRTVHSYSSSLHGRRKVFSPVNLSSNERRFDLTGRSLDQWRVDVLLDIEHDDSMMETTIGI